MQILWWWCGEARSGAGECKWNGDSVFEMLWKELEVWIARKLGGAVFEFAEGFGRTLRAHRGAPSRRRTNT
jgi:hypothetical protein